MSDGAGHSRLRIKSLRLRDFRGVGALNLNLAGSDGNAVDLAVLAGPNGSGKTAVLEAVLMVLDLPDLLPGDAVPRPEEIRFGAERFSIQAHLEQANAVPGEPLVASLDVDFATPERSSVQIPGWPPWKPRDQQIWSRDRPGGWSGPPHLFAIVEYFSARREPEAQGPRLETSGVRSEAHRVQDLKRRLVSAYYRSLNRAPELVPTQHGPFARLQRFWERFSGPQQRLDVILMSNDPGSGAEVVMRDAQRPIPADVTSLAMARELAPSRPSIPRIVPLDRLSSGQLALFAFASPLVFRDAPADIVLIDEPEQHLHARWHGKLLPALRELSPTTQFLVATHSEEIRESAPSHERFTLGEGDDPRAGAGAAGPE